MNAAGQPPLEQLDRTIRGAGTSEADWAGWPGWSAPTRTLAELVPNALVVIAPHPDDETLMAGGLIRAAIASGRAVRVIAMTGGDASHPGSARWPRPVLLAQRRFERARALAILGGAAVTELGICDGQISAQSAYATARIRSELRPDDTVVTTWRYDGHPDHEGTARAVHAAGPARLFEAPVWGWHWADPGQLPPDPVLFELDDDTGQRKREAMMQFRSQLEPDASTGAGPILPDWALPRWHRRCEVFYRAG